MLSKREVRTDANGSSEGARLVLIMFARLPVSALREFFLFCDLRRGSRGEYPFAALGVFSRWAFLFFFEQAETDASALRLARSCRPTTTRWVCYHLLSFAFGRPWSVLPLVRHLARQGCGETKV